MSSALKDRLKRCGRYHVSTPSPKRQCTVGLTQNNEPLTGAENQSNTNTFQTHVHSSNFRKPFMSPLVNNKRSNNVITTPESNLLNKSETPNKQDGSLTLSNKSETPNKQDGSLTLSNKKFRRPFASPLLNIRTPSSGESTPNNVESCESKTSSSQKLCTPNSRKKMRLSLKCRRLDLATESDPPSNCNLEVDQELFNLRKELSDKNEELRKLKMVKMYRSKNDLVQLNALIDKWRKVSQRALSDFLVLLPEPKPTLLQIINHLQIDPVFVNFNTEEQKFK